MSEYPKYRDIRDDVQSAHNTGPFWIQYYANGERVRDEGEIIYENLRRRLVFRVDRTVVVPKQANWKTLAKSRAASSPSPKTPQ